MQVYLATCTFSGVFPNNLFTNALYHPFIDILNSNFQRKNDFNGRVVFVDSKLVLQRRSINMGEICTIKIIFCIIFSSILGTIEMFTTK